MEKLNYNLYLPLQGNDENPSVLTCLGKYFFCTGGYSMESKKVFWSKSFGRNNAKQGTNVNLITMEYTDALGNVLTKLLEKEHDVLFCGDQGRYNGYMRKATRNQYLNIQQERQYECQANDVDQPPLPYINMVGETWVDTVPMPEQNRRIVKNYIDGYTMKEIAKYEDVTEKTISIHLKNITSALSTHVPDIDLTSLPCSFASYVADARTFKRFKEDYIAWPVSKEKGYRLGKTRNEYKNMTTETISMNLVASDPLSMNDNDYKIYESVPLGDALLNEIDEVPTIDSHVIAERRMKRVHNYTRSHVTFSTNRPMVVNPVAIHSDGLSHIRTAVYGVNQLTTA